MKKIYLLFLIFLLIPFASATIIFYDDAESGTFTDNGWNIAVGAASYVSNYSFSGTKSIAYTTSAAGGINRTYNYSSYPYNVTVKYRYISPASDYDVFCIAGVCDGDCRGFGLGVRSSTSGGTTKFGYVLGAPACNWYDTGYALPSNQSWVEFKFEILNETHINGYINNTKVFGPVTVNNLNFTSTAGVGGRFLYHTKQSSRVSLQLGLDEILISNNATTSPIASGGNITTAIINGTNYTVHTFTSNGSFYTPSTINATVLIVAGGGGGGYGNTASRGGAGGGGAGGLIYNSSYNISGTIYVTVGNGGLSYVNGYNSSFGSLIAIGGGRGGKGSNSATGDAGASGGSGGGGGSAVTNSGIGGLGTVGQGFNGSNSFPSGGYPGGAGGGGSSQRAPLTVVNIAGNGGNGTAYDINGTSIYYAGGGGGGAWETPAGGANGNGGLGGGGNGSFTDGMSGINGTGGGGGAGFNGYSGGTGGSGIVIVRYITSSAPLPSVYSIKGKVLNNSVAVNNASVQITQEATNTSWFTFTNSSGQFNYNNLTTTGIYIVTAWLGLDRTLRPISHYYNVSVAN